MPTSPPPPFALRSHRVLGPRGIEALTIVIRDGRIDDILSHHAIVPDGMAVEDLGDDQLLPGFVDTHVHVNEPGRTAWEGFATATQAAAMGGITTLVDMPLNSIPPTTTPEALELKRQAAVHQIWVDVAFWGGLIPQNARNLEPLLAAGVVGVKAFMIDSGIPEFPACTQADLRAAMPVLAHSRLPLLLHAEVSMSRNATPHTPDNCYATYLASRPAEMEVAAIRLAIQLCQEFRAPIHIVHLSAAAALPDLAAARAQGLPITVETCPHYLVFASEDIPDGATAFKCAPPIRERQNQERLWEGLREGIIDFIVCDHSPCLPEMKKPALGNFMEAWGGISSVQLAPAIVWTHALRRGFDAAMIVSWLAARPARLAGLETRKGSVTPGNDADLVVWDADANFRVEPAMLRHRHRVTPYLGQAVSGSARRTYLRGRLVQADGVVSDIPSGSMMGIPTR